MNEEKSLQDKRTFGRFISQKRKEAGLTQHELAARLYLTDTAVSKWERGVTYPDITLISAICEVLHITEHELITASEDVQQIELEKQAEKFRRMVRIYSGILFALYGISLLVCFICNLAVQHTLSWFFIVLTAEAVAFSLTMVPVLVKKNRGLWTLGSFYLSLNLLLLVCRLYVGGDWFLITFLSVLLGFTVVFLPFVLRGIRLPQALASHKTLLCFAVDTVLLFLLEAAVCLLTGYGYALLPTAFPITLYCILLPWLYMAVIRYLRINAFFKTAICAVSTGGYLFLMDSVLHTFIDGAPFALPRVNFHDWASPAFANTQNANILFLIMAVCVGLGLLFAIGGVVWSLIRHNGGRADK